MKEKNQLQKEVGINIQNIRKKMQIEVKEIAFALNISVQGYGAIENGKVDLNLSRLKQIATFFKVDISELLKTKTKMIFSGAEGTGTINDKFLQDYIQQDIIQLKEKLLFFEGVLKKSK